MKLILKLIIAVLILSLLIGCTTGNVVKTNEIKLGGLFGLASYGATWGNTEKNAFLLAIEEETELNIQPIIEDHQSDLKTTATALNKLVFMDKVNIIIGPSWVEFSEVAAPIANENKVLLVSPWETSENSWIYSKYFMTGTPSERVQVKALLENVKEKNFVLVYNENAWSTALKQIFIDQAEKMGFEILKEFAISQDVEDYRTEITKIKNINPDALFVALAEDGDQGEFFKQAYELNLNKQIYYPSARGETPILLENYGQYMENAIYPFPVKVESDFDEKYLEKYGTLPNSPSGATAYDMTKLVIRALKAGARTSDEVREWMISNAKDYKGASTKINLDKNGRVEYQEVIIKQIKDSKPTVLVG